MSKRTAWYAGICLLAAGLLAWGGWWLSREIPGRLRAAESELKASAARRGIRVTYDALKVRLLYPQISLDNVRIDDALAGVPLLSAGNVDLSLSLWYLVYGGSPVSRVRVRNFRFAASDANRPLFSRLSSGTSESSVPDIVLIDGSVRIGPLGPVARWEGVVSRARIRDVRFLGTEIQVAVEKASGDLVVPGAGSGRWPFASCDADLFYAKNAVRIRRLRLGGNSASLKVSGRLDFARREGDLKASGEADVAGWISGDAPGAKLLSRWVQAGKAEFSASLAGTLADPRGSARLSLSGGRVGAQTRVEGEVAVAASNRVIRLEALRGTLWGGTVRGEGSYDLGNGRGDAKLSMSRVALGNAPWSEWGIGWRPAGEADVSVSLSGTSARFGGALSWKNPAGLERPAGAAAPAARLDLPVAVELAAEVAPGVEVVVRSCRIGIAGGWITGRGAVALADGPVSLSGDISVPAGKAADYGWRYPLAWRSIGATWAISGNRSRPGVSALVTAMGVAARDLPPVPAVVKLEGDPRDVIYFVADIPTSAAKATATGTVTGPLSEAPLQLEAVVGARDIAFAELGRWAPAVASSLGKDPAPVARYAGGFAGTGTADLSISVGGGAVALKGSLASPEVRRGDVSVRALALEGEYARRASRATWSGRAAGEIGGGSVRLDGEGADGTAVVRGAAERIDIAEAMSLLRQSAARPIRGTASLHLTAESGPGGWRISRADAAVPRLAAGDTVWEGVAASGSLGDASGALRVASAVPAMRLDAELRRAEGWGASVALAADNVPTAFLLAVLGRTGRPSAGTWSARAEGNVELAGLSRGFDALPDAISGLRFTATGKASSVEGFTFDDWNVSGSQEGHSVAGEISTRGPDTRLAYAVSLREPFGFRVDGTFRVGTAETAGAAREEGKAQFSAEGTARVAGSLVSLEKTTGTLLVSRIRYRDFGVEFAGKDIQAALDSEGARLAGGAVAAAGNPLRVSGKIGWGGDLDVRIAGQMPAASLRIVADVFDRLDGTVRAELRLTGRLENPTVVGTAHLEGGLFAFKGYAQLFEEMKADAVISKEKVLFEHFEGRSGGGYLDGWGELPLAFSAGQKMYFSVDFFNVRYPYPEEFRSVVQGHAEVLGPIDDLLAIGDVEVQSADYTKAINLQEKTLLDFRRRLVDVTARRRKEEFRIRLDVDCIADGTIRVRNNLGDIKAKGEFKIAGDTSRVIVLGSFDILEGTAEWQGNKYEITRLGIDFQDPRRNNPRIDARAETKKGNYTITVAVTGTLEKYEVEFSSDPPLSNNDIVSLLSLGVTTTALTGAEKQVGAGTAASLALGPYKGRVEEGIKGVVGLDKFSIEPAFSSTSKTFESRFVVGKTFAERVSVSLSRSIGTSAETSAAAELKLKENVFLQGSWDSDADRPAGDVGGDFKFKYRFKRFKDFLGRGRD